jgi:hypothetical protein
MTAEPQPESSRAWAKRTFWRTVTSDWRAWVFLAICGLGGIAGGAFFSWGHGRNGVVVWTVAWAAIGLFVALLLIFCALWATGPFHILGTRIDSLAARVEQLDGGRQSSGADPLRVALIAVRSEFATCAIQIQDAIAEQKWWVPDQGLPATQWDKHFAALADPALPTDLHAEIEKTYQHCHRLNRRIALRLAEWAQSQLFKLVTPSSTLHFEEGDESMMREVLNEIQAANLRISEQVDGVPAGKLVNRL